MTELSVSVSNAGGPVPQVVLPEAARANTAASPADGLGDALNDLLSTKGMRA